MTETEQQHLPIFLTRAQVAKIAHLHPDTVSRLAREGKIRCVRFGPRQTRFRTSELLADIERLGSEEAQ